MVPSKQLLISMTFFTVWLAIQSPAVALESVATTMPPLWRKARVVVPWAILMGHCGLEWSSVMARNHCEGEAVGGRANCNDSGCARSEDIWCWSSSSE